MIRSAVAAKTEPSTPILPRWVMARGQAETLDNAAFSSGAALSLLHMVLDDPSNGVPRELVQKRLALSAALHCSKIEGRLTNEADMRDAYLFAAPGDAMGPDGEMLALWMKAVALNFRASSWRKRLLVLLPEEIGEQASDWLDQADDLTVNPVARAGFVLRAALEVFPRQEAIAFLLADVVLARHLGWTSPYPLVASHMPRKVLRDICDEKSFMLACHQAVTRAAQEAIHLAQSLARRTVHLEAITPKLRTKGAEEAVSLFLSEDAIAPSSMLAPHIKGTTVPMTDRSARRLCDRLVELGAVRELTGRATFRLYGVVA